MEMEPADYLKGALKNEAGREFFYPAINEKDFLTLKAKEKFGSINLMSGIFDKYSDVSLEATISKITKEMNWNFVEVESFNNYSFFIFDDLENNKKVYMAVMTDKNSDDYYRFFFYVYTEFVGSDKIFERFDKIEFYTKDTDVPRVTWVTNSSQGLITNVLKVSKNRKLIDCIYPSIHEGVDNFYDNYLKSDSPILIILSPPGMGKTSLIKNMIYKHKLKTMISYDHSLMTSDLFFLFFLEGEYDLLVLEDYDNFLRSRKDDEQSIMDKFLNLSEGLVDISKKKIIFTGNLEKECIDSALVRPGRCYDILEFEPYSYREAETIIKTVGLPETTMCDDRMTLAEIFNNRRGKLETKFGFIK